MSTEVAKITQNFYTTLCLAVVKDHLKIPVDQIR